MSYPLYLPRTLLVLEGDLEEGRFIDKELGRGPGYQTSLPGTRKRWADRKSKLSRFGAMVKSKASGARAAMKTAASRAKTGIQRGIERGKEKAATGLMSMVPGKYGLSPAERASRKQRLGRELSGMQPTIHRGTKYKGTEYKPVTSRTTRALGSQRQRRGDPASVAAQGARLRSRGGESFGMAGGPERVARALAKRQRTKVDPSAQPRRAARKAVDVARSEAGATARSVAKGKIPKGPYGQIAREVLGKTQKSGSRHMAPATGGSASPAARQPAVPSFGARSPEGARARARRGYQAPGDLPSSSKPAVPSFGRRTAAGMAKTSGTTAARGMKIQQIGAKAGPRRRTVGTTGSEAGQPGENPIVKAAREKGLVRSSLKRAVRAIPSKTAADEKPAAPTFKSRVAAQAPAVPNIGRSRTAGGEARAKRSAQAAQGPRPAQTGGRAPAGAPVRGLRRRRGPAITSRAPASQPSGGMSPKSRELLKTLRRRGARAVASDKNIPLALLVQEWTETQVALFG